MSKLLTVVVTLLICLPAQAAEKSDWPKPGDTIFVSSKLVLTGIQKSHPDPGMVTELMHVIDPCTAVTVLKAKPKKEQWEIKDGLGGRHRLEGPWLPELHRTVEECKTRFSERGPIHVVSRGWKHQITPVSESK